MQLAFHSEPCLADVNLGPYGNIAPSNLYNGPWYGSPVPNPAYYAMQNGVLTMLNPGVRSAGLLSTVSTKNTPGNFPLIPAAKGFYITSRHRVRPAQVGNFFAFWSNPIEHNQAKADANAGVECWLEFDVHEGGGGVGRGETGAMWGGIVFWKGVYPNYTKIIFANPYSDLLFDPNDVHDYGFRWDQEGLGSWYIDDTLVGQQNLASKVSAADLAWCNSLSYFLMWSATSSGTFPPYAAELHAFSAWHGT
jgi:hypothetical protein